MFLSVDELFPGFGGRAEPAGVASGCGAEDGHVAVHLRPDVAAGRRDEFVPIRAFAHAESPADNHGLGVKGVDEKRHLRAERLSGAVDD